MCTNPFLCACSCSRIRIRDESRVRGVKQNSCFKAPKIITDYIYFGEFPAEKWEWNIFTVGVITFYNLTISPTDIQIDSRLQHRSCVTPPFGSHSSVPPIRCAHRSSGSSSECKSNKVSHFWWYVFVCCCRWLFTKAIAFCSLFLHHHLITFSLFVQCTTLGRAHFNLYKFTI